MMQMNYIELYSKLIENARNRSVPNLIEMHHITPKCMGGTNAEDNLIALTPKEHYVAHHLLYKIHINSEFKHKLAFAWFCMSRNNHNQERIHVRNYKLAKEAMLVSCSSRTIHRCHKGKIVIHDIATKRIRFIGKDDALPVGWVHGRPQSFADKIRESRKLPSAKFWNAEQAAAAASKGSKGRRWFYNPSTGEGRRLMECPDGFIEGSRKWYNNGTVSKQFIENYEDVGWKRGRLMNWKRNESKTK